MFDSSLLLALPTYNPPSDIVLLLHMDGANGSSSFIDSSPKQFAVTALGGATISTAQTKFPGGGSAYFRTQSNSNESQQPKDRLSIPDDTSFSFGSGDFTIEMFVFIPESVSWNWAIMNKGGWPSGGSDSFLFYCDGVSGARILFSASSNGSSFDICNSQQIVTGATLNTWHHIAVTRYGNIWKGFWNGVQSFMVESALSMFMSTSPIVIRKPGSSLIASAIYVEEARIIKGRAEYIDNFTPPSSPFPDNFNNPPPTISITGPIAGDGTVSGSEEFSPLVISGSSSGADSRSVTLTVGSRPYITQVQSGGSWSVTVPAARVQSLIPGTVQVTADVVNTIGKKAQQASTSFQFASAYTQDADPNFANVSLLLKMTGNNDESIFPDSSSNNVVVAPMNGVITSTAQYKFASGSSAFFDGSNDYIVVPASSRIAFGTGNLTIEAWIRPTTTFGNLGHIWSQRGTGGITWRITTAGRLEFYYNEGFGSFTSSTQMSFNTWYHVALTREGTLFKMWMNGALVGTSSSISYSLNEGLANIGRTTQQGEYFTGYMNDLRVTKSIARYTSPFSVPTMPFPTF